MKNITFEKIKMLDKPSINIGDLNMISDILSDIRYEFLAESEINRNGTVNEVRSYYKSAPDLFELEVIERRLTAMREKILLEKAAEYYIDCKKRRFPTIFKFVDALFTKLIEDYAPGEYPRVSIFNVFTPEEYFKVRIKGERTTDIYFRYDAGVVIIGSGYRSEYIEVTEDTFHDVFTPQNFAAARIDETATKFFFDIANIVDGIEEEYKEEAVDELDELDGYSYDEDEDDLRGIEPPAIEPDDDSCNEFTIEDDCKVCEFYDPKIRGCNKYGFTY